MAANPAAETAADAARVQMGQAEAERLRPIYEGLAAQLATGSPTEAEAAALADSLQQARAGLMLCEGTNDWFLIMADEPASVAVLRDPTQRPLTHDSTPLQNTPSLHVTSVLALRPPSERPRFSLRTRGNRR